MFSKARFVRIQNDGKRRSADEEVNNTLTTRPEPPFAVCRFGKASTPCRGDKLL